GRWTIGYGHTAGVNTQTPPVTEEQADELLRRDVRAAEYAVSDMTLLPLNENQFSALVSFVFNLGSGRFRDSDLRALGSRGAWLHAGAKFEHSHQAGGHELAGLTARRKEERELFLKPVGT